MTDLISRQAAKEAVCYMCRWSDTEECYDCGHPIDELPSIDPVKRGKWLNTSTDIPKLLMNVCSECGFQYPSAIRPRFNYCPNCGAMMEANDEAD